MNVGTPLFDAVLSEHPDLVPASCRPSSFAERAIAQLESAGWGVMDLRGAPPESVDEAARAIDTRSSGSVVIVLPTLGSTSTSVRHLRDAAAENRVAIFSLPGGLYPW